MSREELIFPACYIQFHSEVNVDQNATGELGAAETALRKQRIAIIGGGPSALFVYKRLVEAERADLRVEIFERRHHLGQGMPYSHEGANREHITNVSGNELPKLVLQLAEWVRNLPQEKLGQYGLDQKCFDQDRVMPRLLFGEYLEAQFELLRQRGPETVIHLGCCVRDIRDLPEQNQMAVEIEGQDPKLFDHVVVCTGHNWPRKHEGEAAGYFDSPYPPAKLARRFNHSVALRGGSLTAVDAIRTLARSNGRFVRESPISLRFEPAEESPDFKIVMHTRSGLLPCVRFHLDDPQVTDDGLMRPEDFARARRENDGFVPLDLVFEKDFKKPLRRKDPQLYQRIRAMSLEEFVEAAMDPRERSDPFAYFKAEYAEALASLARRESIPWKEGLAVLSFALNQPAKHFSAEDMLRLKHVLMPLISIVIAFLPQSSCEELLALHAAGRLDLVSVGSDSEVEITAAGDIEYRYLDEQGESQSRQYPTYINCVGQPHLPVTAFPFGSLIEQGVVRQARLTFRTREAALEQQRKDPDSVEQDGDGSYHLIVPGIAINDDFQPVDWDRQAHPRLQLMAVPYMGGHNPDYSGMDFCEDASAHIVDALLNGSTVTRVPP